MFECLARSREIEDGRKRGFALGAWRLRRTRCLEVRPR
jgi:hypothetical protein